MRKLKSILCGALAFVAGSVVLSACGAKTGPQENPAQQHEQQKVTVGTKIPISLSEAKAMIIKALAIDNNQLQTQSTSSMALHAASTEEGNRDIMEKLGTFSYNQQTTEIDIESGATVGEAYISTEMFYQGEIKKCLMESNWDEKPIIDYFDSDNHIRYTYDEEKEDEEKVSSDSYSNEELNTNRFAYVRALFKDEAFDSVYDDTATKEINKNGYSITLTGDLKGWIRYTYFLWGDYTVTDNMIDEMYNQCTNGLPQETIDKCHFNLKVNIDDNNNVVSAAVNLKYIQNDMFIGMSFTLAKTNELITEPEWVTEYKQNHA